MEEVERLGDSAFLRAWGDYERASLQLTAADRPGVGTIAWRTTSDAALERRVAAVEASGRGRGGRRVRPGTAARSGSAIPTGTACRSTTRALHEPVGDQVPALKNQPQRMSTRGVGVRRLDHVNVWCRDIDANSAYMVETLGFRVSEQVVGDDGRLVGSWLHVTPKSYDLAYGRVDPAGVGGRLHHVAFAVDAREYVMRAADVFLDAGVRSSAAPRSTPCSRRASSTRSSRAATASRSSPTAACCWRPTGRPSRGRWRSGSAARRGGR